MLTFDQKLEHLATLALRVGVNLQPDQRLFLIGPIEGAPLMRAITAMAYDMGAPYVHAQYVDQELSLIRAQHSAEAWLDGFSEEYVQMIKQGLDRGDAYLRVSGKDPDLLSAADPARVARMTRAERRVSRPVTDLVMRHRVPWTIVPYAVPAWARKVFPDVGEADATARLWDAVFAATRADQPDPVAAWDAHVAQLVEVSRRLGAHAFDALHLRGPGTDLHLGLCGSHRWESAGANVAGEGVRFVANIPTEEVFTAPHARRVDGVVRASKPLSYQGQLVDGFSLTFEEGRVVLATAERGQAVLDRLLDIDEGARRLGEIALVPHSSPISQSGLLFFDTLFDENAASHIALGNAYTTTVQGGDRLSDDELRDLGFNESLTHVDFMIGSGEFDVDGVTMDGASEPVMRAGEWTV